MPSATSRTGCDQPGPDAAWRESHCGGLGIAEVAPQIFTACIRGSLPRYLLRGLGAAPDPCCVFYCFSYCHTWGQPQVLPATRLMSGLVVGDD